MDPIQKRARIAGLLYVVLSAPAGYCTTAGAANLIVWNDAAATVRNIRASETMFRACMAGEIVSAVGFLFVVWMLYRLFEGVNRSQASLMVIFWLISIPISCLNVLNQIAVLHLVNGATSPAGFDAQQTGALVALFLDLHRYGIFLAQIFWGLWLFPLGLLIFKSRMMPRAIGVLLMAACCAYVVSSFTYLLAPAHGDAVTNVALVLGALGELPLMLWFIIKGVKAPRVG
jgi:hypothetical protein